MYKGCTCTLTHAQPWNYACLDRIGCTAALRACGVGPSKPACELPGQGLASCRPVLCYKLHRRQHLQLPHCSQHCTQGLLSSRRPVSYAAGSTSRQHLQLPPLQPPQGLLGLGAGALMALMPVCPRPDTSTLTSYVPSYV